MLLYPLLMYSFEQISSTELMQQLAERLKVRRLEKGLSRQAYIDLAIALGYADQLQVLMQEAIYKTMEELETIKQNQNRKRGR